MSICSAAGTEGNPGMRIAIRKQDQDLVDLFNKALATIRANGTYQKINAKYFEFDVYGD